ncbi:hypothetical protein F5883DRAFT_560006, partial [Diaporthe sp. PMI_573]
MRRGEYLSLSLSLTSHGSQITLSLCRATASSPLPFPAARRGSMTRGDGNGSSCLVWSDVRRAHGFDLIIARPSLPACHSLIRLLAREAATGRERDPSTPNLLTRRQPGSTAIFWCCRLPFYYRIWDARMIFPFILFCFFKNLRRPPFFPGQLSPDHQSASASQFIPTATFFTPRSGSVSCDSTCTIL